ncbi:hypothetical protein OHA42_02050 [Nocardia sp. NBC_01009]|nr:hypothetical protein OHA42_02050 [Nocardia sp. NBC_01009]
MLHWLESERGLPSSDELRDLLVPYPRHEAFLCGPAPFMTACADALHAIGMPDSHIHHEKFQSLTGDPFADIEVVAAAAPSQWQADVAATATVRLDSRSIELS